MLRHRILYRAVRCIELAMSLIYRFFLQVRGARMHSTATIAGNFRINWPNQLVLGAGVDVGRDVTVVVDGIWSDKGRLSVGAGTEIKSGVHIIKKSENSIFIADNCYLGLNFLISASVDLTIGARSLLAAGGRITDTNHEYDRSIKFRKPKIRNNSIVIGEDVWLGLNVCVLPGVKIGRGAVIAAGSVVRCDIPEWQLWGGVPARFIRVIL